MVLGANLFSIKSKEIADFSKGKDTKGSFYLKFKFM